MPVLGKTKQEILSEFRSAEILQAARFVFARDGYGPARMDEIAEVAGLAKGTLYLYFESKRELFVATLRQGIEELHAVTRECMDQAQTAEQKLRAFITSRVTHADRNGDFFRIYYSEFNNLVLYPAHVREEFQDLYLQQARVLEQVLDQGVREGTIRDQGTASMARLVYDMTRGLIAQRLMGWSQQPVQQDCDFLFEIIWRGIGCRIDS